MTVAPRTELPLVVFVWSVPLLCEAITAALAEVAEVRPFPANGGDTQGLLRSMRPDAVVVDGDSDLDAAVEFARETNAPLVHVRLREGRLRVLDGGTWEEADGHASGEAVRNLVAGRLFGRRGVR